MFRSRLAAVFVSSGLMMLSGCMHWECGPSLFSTPWSRSVSHDCDCACNSTIVGSTSMVMPTTETIVPAPPPVVYSIPSTSTLPPPRLVPQALQTPYAPIQ